MCRVALSVIAVLGLCSPVFGGQPVARSAEEFARVIRADDLAALHRMAATPAAANAVGRLKATPLHYAALYGSPEAVRILLNAGADPNARNEKGATPLVYAAWSFEKTQFLVEKGAEVNAAQNDGVTPLMVAASAHCNGATVRYLIHKGADVTKVDGQHGSACLRAAGLGDPEMLRVLLAHHAAGHPADDAGFNLAHNATNFLDAERMQMALAAGADPNAVNVFGGMVKKGPIALVHLSPLMLAVPYGDPEMVALLLKAGARVDEVDSRHMTPLMFSIATDHANPAVVRQLLAAGADVNAKDQNGESALTWARKYRNPEILALLQSAGAQGGELMPAPQPGPGSHARNAAEALGRSLTLLRGSGTTFFQESGCAGCHHQSAHARAFAAATEAGLAADARLRTQFTDAMIAVRPRISSSLAVLDPPPGDYDVLLAYMMSFADLKQPANEMTDLIVHYVAVRQDSSGAWVNGGIARPPIEESSITRTAQAIRALKLYGWPARRAEFAERIERARVWLESAKPVTTYELADQIAGLQAAGVPSSQLEEKAGALLRLQRADGGWAQTPYLESDAYATGIALSSMYGAGLILPGDAAYRKGVDFLLRTQFPDGSWYVRSRAAKFQPYFQSGFPFDHDQWISSAGTALAAMALAPAAAPRASDASVRSQRLGAAAFGD